MRIELPKVLKPGTETELAYAYARMLTESRHNGHTYNLHGEAITQQQLAEYLNAAFGTDLKYRVMSVAEYRDDRIVELGEFMGNVIAGIYEGIRRGASDNESHFDKAAGADRHETATDQIRSLKETGKNDETTPTTHHQHFAFPGPYAEPVDGCWNGHGRQP